MVVMRLHPWTEFTCLFNEMDRVFHETADGGRLAPNTRTFRPAIDLYDPGKEFVLHALIPGTTP